MVFTQNTESIAKGLVLPFENAQSPYEHWPMFMFGRCIVSGSPSMFEVWFEIIEFKGVFLIVKKVFV